MNIKLTVLLIFSGLVFFAYKGASTKGNKIDYRNKAINLCVTNTSQNLISSIFAYNNYLKPVREIDHQRYLRAGVDSGLTPILANDNRVPAGITNKGTLELNLEVKWGDFRMETPDRPGLRMVAIGEVGKQPLIPSPLIRVKKGTTIHARITNALADSTITVFGLQKRPYTISDSIFIQPGESGEVSFEAGEPGTYLYWMKLGKGLSKRFISEEEQLAGAFIVDPEEGSPNDRVFVMNIFSSKNENKESETKGLESLTINGKSWPFTERMTPAVGDSLNWRVINASKRVHPMHLHGFYYEVLEKGNEKESTIFSEDQRKLVVTESLRGRGTMAMQWVPRRPGNWLFHCHLSFHVSSEFRLPGAEDADPVGTHQHMAGLVIGIQVKEGDSDLISKGEVKNMTLFANESKDHKIAFNWERKIPEKLFQPGPLMILKQYQTTRITLKNEMSIPTSIHWHGLEIDSWSDGVPNWSSSDGRKSPIVEPGSEFTYKLSLMRPGTFVYHSHLDDIDQLTRGLYGPMIVLGENETYNPELDHSYIFGWKTSRLKGRSDNLDLNGWDKVPVQKAKTGESHRIRLINIGPAGNAIISVTKDGVIIPVKTIAKDGADLPMSQQKYVDQTSRLYVGETADVNFSPQEPGVYEIEFKYMMANWKQTWEVSSEQH
jgi:FtsP/CotA-like multicopper oxidase with cupredoxin domain